MKVGDLKVVLKLTVDKFKAGIMQAKAQLKTFSSKLPSLAAIGAKAFQMLQKAVKMFSIAVGIALGAAIIDFSKFQDQVTRTAVILGQGTLKSSALLDTLGAKARQVGRDTLVSASDAAKGMKILAKAGFDAEEILGTIDHTVNMAIAHESDLETTTRVLAATMRQFGLKTEDAGHAADVLTVAANSAMIDIQGLGDALKYSGPVAKAFNNSLEDTVAVTAAMANLGLDASQTGTALRRMLTRLISPSKQASMAMKQLGVNINDGTGKMKPIIQILAELQQKYRSGTMSQLEFNKAIAELAGQRGVTAVLGLLQQEGDVLQQLARNLKDVDGATKNMANEFTKTLPGSTKILISALRDLGITIVNAFSKDLTNGIQKLKDWVNIINVSLQKNKALERIFRALRDGLSPLIDVVKGIGKAFLDWSNDAIAVETFAILLETTLSGLANSIKNLAEALGTVEWKHVINGILAITSGAAKLLELLTKIASIVTKVMNPLSGMFGAGADSSKGIGLGDVVKGAVNPLGFIQDRVRSLFQQTEQAQKTVEESANKQGQAMTQLTDTVATEQAKVSEKIEGAQDQFVKNLELNGLKMSNSMENASIKSVSILDNTTLKMVKSFDNINSALARMEASIAKANAKLAAQAQRAKRGSQ